MLELKLIEIKKPQDVNLILGQSHFIKSVEDIYEVLISNVPGVKFGVAFSEASGACKVRVEGNDGELRKIATDNCLAVSSGHSFVIAMRNAFPINILNAIKNIPEVCNIYCATANPVKVIVAETAEGNGILGVIDGSGPKGVENEADLAWRKEFLRKIGYKL